MKRRVLKFSCVGQRLTYERDAAPIAPGTQGYLWCQFWLDEPWDGLKVACSFYDEHDQETAVLLDEWHMCEVPSEVTGGAWFRVKLTGMGDYMLTTNKVTVRQEVL